jgi:hypothetical protein
MILLRFACGLISAKRQEERATSTVETRYYAIPSSSRAYLVPLTKRKSRAINEFMPRFWRQ